MAANPLRQPRARDAASVQSRIRELIAQRVRVPVANLADEARLEDLGADSLDEIELVMSLEHEFDIDLPDEEFTQVRTVRDVMKQVLDRYEFH
jgi:acyl carrier protein